MDVMIRLTVPAYIYRFYHDAAQHVVQSSAEAIMADALCAYAGLLDKEVAKQQHPDDSVSEEEET